MVTMQGRERMAHPPTASRAIVRTALAEQIHEQLKESIIDQTRPPASRLNIDALGREFGVSSSPDPRGVGTPGAGRSGAA